MKKIILNFDDMSDSKEVYGQRPNPVITVFIYLLVGVLVVAMVYSCIGKIEIVTTASGIVRPNESVSTVSSFLDGRVDGVYYADGQSVKKGDILLTIDTSDKETSLDTLKEKFSKYTFQNKMCEKFLDGIENEKNPFSDNPTSREYAYYVKYENYKLSLKNSKQSIEYDAEKNAADLRTVKTQIAELENRLDGLNAYRNSIIKGENLTSNYPVYENMYKPYASAIDKLDDEYHSQKEAILRDSTDDNNEMVLKQYEIMVAEYKYLVTSIQNGKSLFPDDDKSVCYLLYENYLTTLENYENAYEKYSNEKNSDSSTYASVSIPTNRASETITETEVGNLSPTTDYIEAAREQMDNSKCDIPFSLSIQAFFKMQNHRCKKAFFPLREFCTQTKSNIFIAGAWNTKIYASFSLPKNQLGGTL